MCDLKLRVAVIIEEIERILNSDIDSNYRNELIEIRKWLLQAARPEATVGSILRVLEVVCYYVVDWRLLDRDDNIGKSLWGLREAYKKLLKKSLS